MADNAFYMIYQEEGSSPIVLILREEQMAHYEDSDFITPFRFLNKHDAQAACSAYDLYSYIIKTSKEAPIGAELFTLRYYDAFDGWIDILKAKPREEVDARYNELTHNGTVSSEKNKAPMGEYYCIFPADTKMMFTPESLGR
jgi:hypothetical protein